MWGFQCLKKVCMDPKKVCTWCAWTPKKVCTKCACASSQIDFLEILSRNEYRLMCMTIGGQAGVNLCKLCKLFLTQKSDFAWLNPEGVAHSKHVIIGSESTGHEKLLRNCWDFWVCIWWKKVYTWLILVCTGPNLVYTRFAHRRNQPIQCSKFIHE